MTTGPKYQIDVGELDDARLVTVSGEIDLASAPRLEEALTAGGGDTVIADLLDVGFIDSTGLRSLMTAKERISDAGGRLLLVSGDGPVERILDLTRLTDRFEVFSTVDEAAQGAK